MPNELYSNLKTEMSWAVVSKGTTVSIVHIKREVARPGKKTLLCRRTLACPKEGYEIWLIG